MTDYHLLIHNALFLGGGVLNILLAAAVLWVRRKSIDSLVVTFVLMTLSVVTFQISQVLGVNAPDAETSRRILMFNLTVIPIAAFMTHWFFALIGIVKERRAALTIVYGSGALLLAIHLVFPHTYLLASVPKMYFPFYYNPGPLQWVTRVWFILVGFYYFAEIFAAWRRERDPIKRNRYLYVMVAIMYGFVVGSSALFLVYNVSFDPMWSSFFGLYTFMIAYVVVRYQLLEVRIIIRRAFIYAFAVAVLIAFISFSNILNAWIQAAIPGFPVIVAPLVWSLIGVGVGISIWSRLSESDVLKYEFITIIAHKFRTPLTQVKWIVEGLLEKQSLDPDTRNDLRDVAASNQKLVSLTGTLIELAETDSAAQAFYSFKRESLCALVDSVIAPFKGQFEKKGVELSFKCPAEDVFADLDPERMKFVIQTLAENAYAYTPAGGKVTVAVGSSARKGLISVADTGIGIAGPDIPRLFNKFYRSGGGKTADTEGFGVGLYLAKSVVERHGGKISVSSEGENKGSTFSISLPISRR